MAATFRPRPLQQLLAVSRPHLNHGVKTTRSGSGISETRIRSISDISSASSSRGHGTFLSRGPALCLAASSSPTAPIVRGTTVRRVNTGAKHRKNQGKLLSERGTRQGGRRLNSFGEDSPAANQADELASNGIRVNMIHFMLPKTFIAQPLSRGPRNIREFFAYQYQRVRQRLANIASVWMFAFSTRPSFFKAAKWKGSSRRGLVPMAKGMHREMMEAHARGDKPALAKLLTDKAYTSMASSIDGRRRGRRFEWELVRYTGRVRIADRKVSILPLPIPGVVPPAVQQIVVAIPSRQRLSEYDDARGGALVEGSVRERDMLEYVVLLQLIDPRTRLPTEWRIWGTAVETSLADWRDIEKALLEKEEENKKQDRQKLQKASV